MLVRYASEGVAVFGWLKRKPQPSTAGELVAAQPPGEIFPWPNGAVLTAVDELVLALPVALFDKDRPMSEFVFGPEDMQMDIPPEGDTFFVRLMPAYPSVSRSPCSRTWSRRTESLAGSKSSGRPPRRNPPMQRTGAAGTVSVVRKVLGRGSGR